MFDRRTAPGTVAAMRDHSARKVLGLLLMRTGTGEVPDGLAREATRLDVFKAFSSALEQPPGEHDETLLEAALVEHFQHLTLQIHAIILMVKGQPEGRRRDALRLVKGFPESLRGALEAYEDTLTALKGGQP